MKFENFQKVSDSNDVRKGIVGDWMNHFTKDLNMEYNKWIIRYLEDICIQDTEVVGYFKLYVEL